MWTPSGNSTPREPRLESDDSLQRNRLNQIFNTALVSSRADEKPDSAGEIKTVMDSSAFGSILQSIQLLAGERSISEIEAAREVIRTFRKMDLLWTEYLVSEGVERLKLSN